jgi:FeS assembly SUF system regulator
MILVHLAMRDGRVCSASDIAAGTHVALPMAQKILKTLARAGLVKSERGADGGYALAKPAAAISAAQILDVLEGPVAITECSTADSHCVLEALCQVGTTWQKINKAIRLALSDISLANLAKPPRDFPVMTIGHAQPRSGRLERS